MNHTGYVFCYSIQSNKYLLPEKYLHKFISDQLSRQIFRKSNFPSGEVTKANF
jgi:hypothetical protein